MTAENHLLGLPLGQHEDPASDIVRAVDEASSDAVLIDLANQVADAMIAQIRLAGPQHFLQSSVGISLKTDEPPAAILERALFNTKAELENARRELAMSDSRLAEHRRALQ